MRCCKSAPLSEYTSGHFCIIFRILEGFKPRSNSAVRTDGKCFPWLFIAPSCISLAWVSEKPMSSKEHRVSWFPGLWVTWPLWDGFAWWGSCCVEQNGIWPLLTATGQTLHLHIHRNIWDIERGSMLFSSMDNAPKCLYTLNIFGRKYKTTLQLFSELTFLSHLTWGYLLFSGCIKSLSFLYLSELIDKAALIY